MKIEENNFMDLLVSFLSAREKVIWAKNAPNDEKAYWDWDTEERLVKNMEKAAKKLNKYIKGLNQ